LARLDPFGTRIGNATPSGSDLPIKDSLNLAGTASALKRLVIGLWRAICAIHSGRSIAKRAFNGGPVLGGGSIQESNNQKPRLQDRVPRTRFRHQDAVRREVVHI
jgi:hypothetical protein